MFIRVVSVLVLVFSPFLTGFAERGSNEKEGPERVAEMAVFPDIIAWQPLVHGYRHIQLTVSGPGGVYLHKNFARGEDPYLEPVDEQGNFLPDGFYNYELRVLGHRDEDQRNKFQETPERRDSQALREGQNRALREIGPTIQSGHFLIEQGGLFPTDEEKLDETVSFARSGDPGGIKFYDAAGNWTVAGLLGVGTETPGSPVTIEKTMPYIGFKDTSSGGSTLDWTLDGFDDYFAIWRPSTGNVIEVNKDAPQNSLVIDGSGQVGIGTATPSHQLTLASDGPVLAFDDTSETTDWAWGTVFGGLEAYQCSGGGCNQKFGIEAPSGGATYGHMGYYGGDLLISDTGNLPEAAIHLRRPDGTAKLLVEERSGTTAARTLFHLQNRGRIRFTMENTGTGKFWSFTAYDSSFAINHSGSAGSELRVIPSSGDLEVKGEVYAVDFHATSDRNLKEDFTALDSQEVLDKVAGLPITEWEYKVDVSDTRHIGPVAQDFHALFGVGKDDRHINPMDLGGVSLIAIQGLYEMLVEKEAEIESLRAELAEIKAMVAQ
jgi:hypothetical protein